MLHSYISVWGTVSSSTFYFKATSIFPFILKPLRFFLLFDDCSLINFDKVYYYTPCMTPPNRSNLYCPFWRAIFHVSWNGFWYVYEFRSFVGPLLKPITYYSTQCKLYLSKDQCKSICKSNKYALCNGT